MSNKIQLRRDTSANWTTANSLLSLGEVGIETDTRKAKIGDGVTNWTTLPYGFVQDSTSGSVLTTGNQIIDGIKTFIKVIQITLNSAIGTTLTNPMEQSVNTVNNFTQIAIQNKNAGTSASADFIAYPDNNTNDTTGFIDNGMTSSAFADASYTVTGQNEAYTFSSAPAGVSKSGSYVVATDSTGTNNNIEWFVGGFNKLKTAFSARILGSNGLFQIAEGLSYLAKQVIANGATTTITIPAKKSYVYITSSAASLAFTLPAASASIDGLLLTMVVNTSIATVTFASTGATFQAAPTACTANVPINMIYDHATLKWYPA